MAVKEGKIAAVAAHIDPAQERMVIEVGSLYVLPGRCFALELGMCSARN
ncbi:MAG: hypothetical protein HYR60_30610 [Acidobacteria bacterium]|nr:hypothetical protein [Acidobacteriota bacterium]